MEDVYERVMCKDNVYNSDGDEQLFSDSNNYVLYKKANLDHHLTLQNKFSTLSYRHL